MHFWSEINIRYIEILYFVYYTNYLVFFCVFYIMLSYFICVNEFNEVEKIYRRSSLKYLLKYVIKNFDLTG